MLPCQVRHSPGRPHMPEFCHLQDAHLAFPHNLTYTQRNQGGGDLGIYVTPSGSPEIRANLIPRVTERPEEPLHLLTLRKPSL